MGTKARLSPKTGRKDFLGGLIAGALAGALCPGAAGAEPPAALVEAIAPERPDLQLMDYLAPGRRIALSAGDRLVLGYLTSCLVETIEGGTVVIGVEESAVEGGRVERRPVDCDGGQVQPGAGQGLTAAAAMAFREGPAEDDAPEADRVIYGLGPVVKFTDRPQPFEIRRLDADAAPISVDSSGTTADLAERGIRLAPAGLYAFTTADRRVSEHAAEEAPAVSRLVPL